MTHAEAQKILDSVKDTSPIVAAIYDNGFKTFNLGEIIEAAKIVGREEGTKNITRVEVIDQKGRSYVNWDNKNKVRLSFQDDGRTLKVFITNNA